MVCRLLLDFSDVSGMSERKKKKATSRQSSSSSTLSCFSTKEISQIVEELQLNQHRSLTRKNYYAVWRLFNQFYIKLDVKPTAWEDRLTLFVGHLIQMERQSQTVKSYISAIKAVLKMHKIKIEEDHYLLSSLTRACQLKNDHLQARLPIHKGMLAILVRDTEEYFCNINQPFLACLFKTLQLTMYYGMFRISEVMTGAHPVLARDVHIGKNKKKFLFILRTSKTHTKGMPPQLVERAGNYFEAL